MRHILKALLLWCLLFAVPFQAAAAAGAFACEMAPSEPACHDGMEPAIDDAGGCDACSTCSLGAGMAAPVVARLMLPEQHLPALAAHVLPLPAGDPGTLERPPRHALA